MWKLLKISEQSYFIICNFNDITKDFTFMLYDFEITWSETTTIKNVKQKVKILNKRLDFNEDNIKEALTTGSIHSAVLEDTRNNATCLLNLNYRVKNCLLNYEWRLRKQNLLEFQQIIVQPVLSTLLDCEQQIEILTDSLRKKDIELRQFRIEGAELNRKTLVTKPFDFENFGNNFQVCNKTLTNFKELAKYIKETKLPVNPEVNISENLNTEKPETSIKPQELVKEVHRANIKISPRQMKRKAKDIKLQHLQRHLKLHRQGIKYESSQSQTPSSGGSQTVEIPEVNDSKRQRQTISKKQEISKSENLLSLRKSTRCSTLKHRQEKMSSDDKTDSDHEEHLKTSRQKRAARCLDSFKADVNLNSNNKDIKATTITDNQHETEQRKTKSFNLSNNAQTKAASSKCLDDLNIFDFIIESDDDVPLLKSRKTQKTKKEQGSQPPTSNKLTKEASILSLSTSPVPYFASVESINSLKSQPLTKVLSQSPTPVIINEISSQLDNIKKELETLEAMRLADLKQRLCKV